MKHRIALRLAGLGLGLAALLAVGTPSARAEFFEYTSTVEITSFLSPPGSTVVSTAGGGTTASITAPGTGNSVVLNAQNSSLVNLHQNAFVGTNIVPLSLDPNGDTPTADNFDFNFTLRVTVTDYPTPIAGAPNGTGTFTFLGRLTGAVGNFASNLTLFSFAPSPQSLFIGTETYTVSFNGFTPPGIDNNGTLGLRVRAVPEPTSLALLGLGGVGALGLTLRRRMAKASV